MTFVTKLDKKLFIKCEALLRLAFSERARARSGQLYATITQNLFIAQFFLEYMKCVLFNTGQFLIKYFFLYVNYYLCFGSLLDLCKLILVE